jgi:hypothetical protein
VPFDPTYQGTVYVDDAPFSGTGYFKLVLVDSAGTTLWSNDSTSVSGSEPTASFAVTVNEGIFNINIGNTALMTALDPAIFNTAETITLQAWFDDGSHGFSAFNPPIQITPSIYSFNSQFFRGYAPDDFLKITDQITSGQIAAGAVGTTQISNGSITGDKITAFSSNSTIFTIGSGAAGTNVIYANQGAATNPGLRYDSGTSTWQFSNNGVLWNDIGSGAGSGTVNAGLINQMTWYAAAGDTVSGLATANNGVLITSAAGVPSISSTLPAAVQGNITAVGTVTSGVWNGTAIDDAHVADNLTISGGTVNNSPIGGVVASTGKFTTLTADNLVTLLQAAIAIGPYGVGAGNTGEERFLELAAGGVNYVGFKAPDAIAANRIWTLPNADGAAGQLLSTNGSGILGWTTAAVGDVVGPGSSTTNRVALFSDGTGKAIKESAGVLIDGSNNVTGVAALSITSMGANWTNAGRTVADLGSITTADINGGTIDNATIGGATAAAGKFTSLEGQTVKATTSVQLEDPAVGTNTITNQAPAGLAGNYTLTWPVDDGTASQVLTTNGSGVLSWTSAAVGDVVGPAGATDNAVTRYDTATGKLVQNSGVLIDDTNNVTGVAALSIDSMGKNWTNAGRTIADMGTVTTEDVNGGTIDGTSIGATTPAAGTFTLASLLESGGGADKIGLQSPVLAASYTLTLPVDDGTANQVLKTDGSGVLSWTTAAVGDVVGPAGATDNAVTRYDTATGKLVQNSGVLIDDTNNVTGVAALSIDSMGKDWTNAGRTVADLGSVTTGDINGGTIDGTTVGATTPAAGKFTLASLLESGGGADTITMQSPALAASYTLTWPVDDGTANQMLKTDGSGVLSWTTAAVGDVVGPAGATDNAVTRYDTATGKLVQNSGVLIDDTNNVTGVAALSIDSMGKDWTNAGRTVADLGSVTTGDVNGGTIDGTTVGGTTPAAGTFLALQTGTNGTDGQLSIYSEQGGTDYMVTFYPNAAMTMSTAYVMPPDDGAAGQLLSTNGSGILGWTTGAAGDVTGPGSSTTNRVALFSDGTGKAIKESAGVLIDGSNNVTGVAALSITSMGGNWTNAGRTVADLGSITTVDINGGTIDGTTIGGATAAAGTFTSLVGQTVKGTTSVILEDPGVGTNTITNQAPAGLAGNYTLTWPVDDGTGSQVLTTDGSGALSWTTPTTGTVTAVTASAPLASSGGATPDISFTGTLAIGNGGTGATTAPLARTSLGLAIGTNVQAWDPQLDDIAALAVTDGNFIVGDGSNWVAENGATARTSLGLGSIATQAANNVAITGGAIDGTTIGGTTPAAGTFTTATATTGLVLEDPVGGVFGVTLQATTPMGANYTLAFPATDGGAGQVLSTNGGGQLGWTTPTTGTVTAVTASAPLASSGGATPDISFTGTLAIGNGGTGATTAPLARTSLGLAIGTNVQAWDPQLDDIAALAVTDGNFIVGDGSNWVAESGATARTSLGLGTIATQAANSVAITGGAIDGTTIGGTTPAAGTFTLAYLLESGGGSDMITLQSPALAGSYSLTLPVNAGAASQVLTTDGSGVLSWANAGSGTVTAVTASAPLASSGGATPDISFTGTLAIGNGGTGATTAPLARTSLGLAIGTNVQAWDPQLDDIAALAVTDGNFIVGDGSNWVAESGATARTSLGLGSIATQAANNVAITGGAIDGTTIGGTTPAAGTFTNAKLLESGGGADTITMQSPALAAAYTLTWPVDDGTASQVLTTNGSGTLSWSSAGNPNMDATYNNFGAVAPTIVVDAAQGQTGPLTFQSNAASTTGNIAIDLNSTGDFIIKDATVAFVTFNDNSTTDFSATVAADRIIDVSQGGNGGGVLVTNAGTGNGIYVDQNGNTGAANDAGSLVVENTGQTDRAVSIYSNQNGTQAQSLVQIFADNALFDEKTVAVRNDGTNTALEIDTNTGPGTGAPMRLVPSATPTTNLAGGQMFFDSTTNLLYYYDSSRTKWLSVEGYSLEFGTNGNSDGAPLGFGGAVTNTSVGARMPYDGTILYVTAMQNGGLATKQFDVQINGATSFSFSLVASVYSETNRNQNFAANDRLTCATNVAGAAAADPTCILFVKWRK